MKTNQLFLLTLAIGASAAMLLAQDAPQPPPGGTPGGPGGPRGDRPRQPMPIIEVLDTNKDGTIDATEIANASASLLKLDKNGDGKLTADEYHPQRPGGEGRPKPQ